MNKKTIKLVSAMLTVAIVLMALTSSAFAISSPKEIDGNVTDTGATTTLVKAGNQIVNIIRTVGMIVAVVILMVLGIKYMMGSSEEKASYKKTMMPYLVGAILLFGASALAGIVFDFAKTIGT